jgi:hypothetical protein
MIIKFNAIDKLTWEVKDKPQPASAFVPNWWKDMPSFSVGTKFDLNPSANVTAKKCFPLLDSITAGYIVTLWADILVTQNSNGSPYIKWAVQTDVLQAWSHQQSQGYEIPEGYDKTVFKNYHGWIIETPKNYSCLITHPIGFPNLPFRTLTGIVDTDKLKTDANAPFVVKKDFEGIIEKGTPMFQIIPFKRDKWKSEFEFKDDYFMNGEKLHSKIISSYGRFLRTKKEYT